MCEAKAKEKPVCRRCKSSDVMADAYAEWNVEAQRWEVANTFDKGAFCNRCDGETTLDWVPVDTPEPDDDDETETEGEVP